MTLRGATFRGKDVPGSDVLRGATLREHGGRRRAERRGPRGYPVMLYARDLTVQSHRIVVEGTETDLPHQRLAEEGARCPRLPSHPRWFALRRRSLLPGDNVAGIVLLQPQGRLVRLLRAEQVRPQRLGARRSLVRC